MNTSLFIGSLFFALSSTLHAQPLQKPEQVAALVEAYLHDKAQSHSGSASIHVASPTIHNQAACEQFSSRLGSSSMLRPRMTVTVRCQAPESWTLRVKAEVAIEGYYYTSNRTLDVGQTISLDDLVPHEDDLLRLPASVITDPSHIVGYITTQRIKSGNIIRANALRDPESIVRGQTVRTEVHGAGFNVLSEGVALQSGAPGSQVQVRASSGKIIQGTVLNAQSVQVF